MFEDRVTVWNGETVENFIRIVKLEVIAVVMMLKLGRCMYVFLCFVFCVEVFADPRRRRRSGDADVDLFWLDQLACWSGLGLVVDLGLVCIILMVSREEEE